MDVEEGDVQEPGGVRRLVVVGTHDVVEDLVHAGTHETFSYVDGDSAVIEYVGLHGHDLGEGIPGFPGGVVGDHRIDPLTLLLQTVRQQELSGSDVDSPHEALRLRVLGDILAPGEAAVVVGIPKALGVEELLLLLGKRIIRLLGVAEDEVYLLLRTGVVFHSRLYGKPVSVIDFHVRCIGLSLKINSHAPVSFTNVIL